MWCDAGRETDSGGSEADNGCSKADIERSMPGLSTLATSAVDGGGVDAVGNVGGSGGGGSAAQVVFRALRPVCSELLQHRNDAVALHACLAALAAAVDGAEPSGLAGCFDYVMFPLLLVVDSIAPARSAMAGTSGGGSGGGGSDVAVPAARSDRVADAALTCVRDIVACCGARIDADQALEVVQRLMPMLQAAAQRPTSGGGNGCAADETVALVLEVTHRAGTTLDWKGGVGGAVWEERCGRSGLGGAAWEERCGRSGLGGAAWEERPGRSGLGGAVWEERPGRSGLGGAVWEERCGRSGTEAR
eukprot:365182-Chlamydomonas_euryale.AAC.11